MNNPDHLCDATCRALAADALETRRTAVLRDLEGAARLLYDARHALGAGRLDVVDEFTDRVLTTITDNLSRLRDVPGWYHDCAVDVTVSA